MLLRSFQKWKIEIPICSKYSQEIFDENPPPRTLAKQRSGIRFGPRIVVHDFATDISLGLAMITRDSVRLEKAH